MSAMLWLQFIARSLLQLLELATKFLLLVLTGEIPALGFVGFLCLLGELGVCVALRCLEVPIDFALRIFRYLAADLPKAIDMTRQHKSVMPLNLANHWSMDHRVHLSSALVALVALGFACFGSEVMKPTSGTFAPSSREEPGSRSPTSGTCGTWYSRSISC